MAIVSLLGRWCNKHRQSRVPWAIADMGCPRVAVLIHNFRPPKRQYWALVAPA